MIRFNAVRCVPRPADDVFNVVATRAFENHPKWEDEVVEVRRVTPEPMGVGSRAVMVREEYGKRREVEYEVTEYEPNRRIAFRHLVPNSTFELSTDVRELTATSSEFEVTVLMGVKGMARLLEPLMRLGMPKRGARIMADMARVAETEPVVPAQR